MEHAKALRTFRSLVRASRLAFKSDDEALTAAMDKIRAEYRTHAQLDRDEFLQKIQFAKDVAHILRCNVVQGRPTDTGSFKLVIHKDSELGDNSDSFGKTPCDTLTQSKNA